MCYIIRMPYVCIRLQRWLWKQRGLGIEGACTPTINSTLSRLWHIIDSWAQCNSYSQKQQTQSGWDSKTLLFLKGWNLTLSLPPRVPTTSYREKSLRFDFPTGFSSGRLARSGIYFAVVSVVFFGISHDYILLLRPELLSYIETLCWCFLSLGCL